MNADMDRMKTELYHELKYVLLKELDERSNTLGTTRCNPANSCADVAPWRPDGLYWIVNRTDNSPSRVYCLLNGHPRCGGGVWMRTGYFDTGESAGCPSPLRQYDHNGTQYCVRNTSRGCSSVYFGSYGQRYGEVCGMIQAYQVGGMDGFYLSKASSTLNDPYVFGVSITHGPSSSRCHVWTYAVGFEAKPTNAYTTRNNCPCTKYGTTTVLPNFLGTDYYCDSGNPVRPITPRKFYPTQLWLNSGPLCASGSTCCNNPHQPWFKRVLNYTTTDVLELRWCAHLSGYKEAVPTKRVEVYIRVKWGTFPVNSEQNSRATCETTIISH